MNKLFISCMAAALLALTACSGSHGDSGSKPAVKESAQSRSSLPTVMDFSATWCGPCQAFAPVFHANAEKYEGMVNFVTVDVDEHPDLAQRYAVQAVPTLVFLDSEGNVVNIITGAPSESEFQAMVEKLMGKNN